MTGWSPGRGCSSTPSSLELFWLQTEIRRAKFLLIAGFAPARHIVVALRSAAA
ncbi:MAG: hypothetical protein R3A52_26475 [Polyangiales bacterium]